MKHPYAWSSPSCGHPLLDELAEDLGARLRVVAGHLELVFGEEERVFRDLVRRELALQERAHIILTERGARQGHDTRDHELAAPFVGHAHDPHHPDLGM